MNDRPQARSDKELVAAICARDKPALSELYERHAGLLMSVGYRVLNNRHDAEDLIHDVILELWKKAENYDPARSTVKSWLVLVTRSRAIDRIRSLSVARAHAMVAYHEESSVKQPHGPEKSLEAALVRAAVHSLDEAQRTVLNLHYFDGLTCKDIAERLDMPLGTIKSRLRAAVKTLRTTFKTTGTIS